MPLNDVQFGILCRALRRSNRLAKLLNGCEQQEEYQTKADLVSFLVLQGRASANGIVPDGTICVDINYDHASRYKCHIKRRHLHPQALALLEQQLAALSVKCSIREIVKSKK